jgi:hypothetical protein
MSKDFPKANDSNITGRRRVTQLQQHIEQEGWIFRRQNSSDTDFGVDVEIELVQDNHVTGRLFKPYASLYKQRKADIPPTGVRRLFQIVTRQDSAKPLTGRRGKNMRRWNPNCRPSGAPLCGARSRNGPS